MSAVRPRGVHEIPGVLGAQRTAELWMETSVILYNERPLESDIVCPVIAPGLCALSSRSRPGVTSRLKGRERERGEISADQSGPG